MKKEQSPLILTEVTEQKKKQRYMTLEMQDLAWDKCG